MAKLEREKEKSGKGFDKPMRKPIGTGMKIFVTLLVLIAIAIIIGAVSDLMYVDSLVNGGGGGGGSYCPTSCSGAAITIAPSCTCPSDSTYYNTISNPPSMAGYKQCICD